MEAEAEAESIRLRGEAEAAAIQAKAKAEAEQMSKKADAFREYRQAAIVDMLLDALPKVCYQVTFIMFTFLQFQPVPFKPISKTFDISGMNICTALSRCSNLQRSSLVNSRWLQKWRLPSRKQKRSRWSRPAMGKLGQPKSHRKSSTSSPKSPKWSKTSLEWTS